MLDVSALYALSYSFLLAVVFYLVLTRFSRGEKNKFSFFLSFGEKPDVRYRQDSRLCKQLASACSTLERYNERGRREVTEICTVLCPTCMWVKYRYVGDAA